MEFLVRIETVLPPGMDGDEESRLFSEERAAGIALRNAGTISRIWSVPGTPGNVGIWVANDASELHAHLRALPMFRYFRIDVLALATHPLEASSLVEGTGR